MANPTTNYGFVLPTSTDLVTDLPADFDVALQGVDTRLKALQPGTTLGDLMYASATANTNTRLAIGSTGNVLTVAGGVPTWAAPGGSTLQVFTVNETQASGTQGGTFTSGAFRTRTLNTSVQNTITGASLASNQITLPAGTYFITAIAPAFSVDNHTLRLFNITDTTQVLQSNNAYALSGTNTQTAAIVSGTFAIVASKVFEIQHLSANTKATNGFGAAAGMGINEIYASASIVKVG